MGSKFKIYTKTGDDGTTGLVGGTRVRKQDARLEAYGTVDELNACHRGGAFISHSRRSEGHAGRKYKTGCSILVPGLHLMKRAKRLQHGFRLLKHISKFLEKHIDLLEEELPELTHFILPGGDMAAAQCHVARTVCRRAERRILNSLNKAKWSLKLSDI
jgi:cob(I)alamin adenosyltransferase